MNWNDKRVLVTGAGGFIGSHLTETLVHEGARVRAFVHYNALGSKGWLDDSLCQKDMEIIFGDIRDRDSVRSSMKDIEIVFHLAALIGIPYSYNAPVSYVQTNIEGTLNVLQSALELGVGRIVHTSTSEVYGTAIYVPINESHPLQAQSPYSATKIGADKLAESFHLSFKLPVVIVRPFNTFGPRQSSRAVIPTIIGQCLSGRRVQLGNLRPTRDLNYVSNTVGGFLLAGSNPNAIGRTINLGSGKEINIEDLAVLIARLTDTSVELCCDEERMRPEKSEVERLLADSSLARKVLGWEPAVTLEQGLIKTIEWFKQNKGRYSSDDYRV